MPPAQAHGFEHAGRDAISQEPPQATGGVSTTTLRRYNSGWMLGTVSTQVVTVADADTSSHEAAMHAQGMHLVEKTQRDDSTWRYTWSSTRPTPTPTVVKGASAASTPPGRVPSAPSPPPSSDDGDLEALTDDLIAGYQAVLSQARALDVDQRALVTHTVAESAQQASQHARVYRSEAIAHRLIQFRNDLPDLLGTLLGIARAESLKWMRGQLVSALATGGLAAAYAKVAAAVGGLIGGAAGVLAAYASLGAELFRHGSAIHLLMLVLYAFGGYLADHFWDDVEKARNSTQPATQVLRANLDEPEQKFFAALGTKPPTRATLKVAGPAQAGVLILGVGIACALVAAVLFGGLARAAAQPV